MINLPNENSLRRGLLLFNVSGQTSHDLAIALCTRFTAPLYTYDQNNILDEATKSKFYEIYNLPEDQRAYSVIHINQENLVVYAEQLLPLILEARPLRIIFVIDVSVLNQLPSVLQDMLFANIPNYVFGALSAGEKNDLIVRLGDGIDVTANSISYISEPAMVRYQANLN